MSAHLLHEAVATEQHHVRGHTLLAKVRELVDRGNVRRVVIKNEHGDTLLEIPLTLGVVGAVLAPVWAALGALAALAAKYTIVVERAGDARDFDECGHG